MHMFILMHNGLVYRTQASSNTAPLCFASYIFFPGLCGNYVFSSLVVTVMVSLTLISVAPKGTILETVVTHFQCILFI